MVFNNCDLISVAVLRCQVVDYLFENESASLSVIEAG
jgi:hypothetical protein